MTLGARLVGDLPPLGPGGLGIILGKGGADEGRDDAAALLAGMRQHVAHEVAAAALVHEAFRTLAMAAFSPSWASEMTSLTPRRPRRASLVGVGAEGLGLRRADRQAQHLASAVAIDADRDDHRDRDNATVAAGLA